MSRWLLVVVACSVGCASRVDSSAPDDARADADADAVSDEGRITCFVDFPCMTWQAWTCTSENGGRYNESKSCEFRCGSEPCSGGSCEPGAAFACASGTRCVELSPEWSDGGALAIDEPCQPIVGSDGGSSD